MKLTRTTKNDQDADASTEAGSAALATALRLYSLHEQVEMVERVSVGWTGEGYKAIIQTAIALKRDRGVKTALATEQGISHQLQTNITTTDIYVFC